jgi:hypothetical protein
MSERTGARMAQNNKNLYQQYFQEYIPVTNSTNLCISYAENPVATIYNFHGLWGSPIEDWMRNTFQTLLDNNINIVSVETVPLSLTAGKMQQTNYLETLRTSIENGLNACKKIERLEDTKYNIANPHSMACRALLDLMFEKPEICEKFNTTIFNNAYLIPSEKFYLISNTPLWDRLQNRHHPSANTINNIDYRTTSIAKYLFIKPINKKMQKAQDENNLNLLVKLMVGNIFKLYPDLQINFIQGTGDSSTIYRNEQLFEHLYKYEKINIGLIPKADHTFSNALEEYVEFFKKTIDLLNVKQLQQSA